MQKLLVFMLLASSCSVVMAAPNLVYQCSQGNQKRTVEVVYQNSDTNVPCNVRYEKNGQTETLWTYNNEAGQCELQAQGFLEKQRSWGWQCNEQSTTANDD